MSEQKPFHMRLPSGMEKSFASGDELAQWYYGKNSDFLRKSKTKDKKNRGKKK